MAVILIADDEQDIGNALELYLRPEGYDIRRAFDGEDTVRQVQEGGIDLVLLDIMMPGLDGLSALSRIRSFSNVPVILLTAKSEDTDKVLGLNIGADDYITKPFNPAEVIARCRSQIRRYTQLGSCKKAEGALCLGGITLDDSAKAVTVDGESVSLTPSEYGILKFLMTNSGTVFSSKQIYEALWHESAAGSESSIAVHIRHLREKVEINPSQPRHIVVVWGQGYRFDP